MISIMKAIIIKDWLTEYREKTLFSLILTLSFLLWFFFSMSLDAGIGGEEGVLWMVLFLLISLSCNRYLQKELDKGQWEGIQLAPLDLGIYFLAKWIGFYLFLLPQLVIQVPLFLVFFHVRVENIALFIISLLIGTAGISVSSVFISLISIHTSLKEFMVIVLQLPLTIPLLIGMIEITRYTFGFSANFPTIWLALTTGFTFLFIFIPSLLLSLMKGI